ncbi:MAG: Bax inhibitor-1/YccA family protein [Paludibacteraceae bacterium]|nr:Bax inhibitor-1/YccA family protein [Paludibacteraceae bacterium]
MEDLTMENTVIDERRQEVVGQLMRNVYLWMTGGLALTGLVAWYVASSPAILSIVFGSSAVLWGLFIAELILVGLLSALIQKLSFSVASLLFVLYCTLNGVVFSSIFLAFELGSIGQVFFITAGMFAGLAVIGTVTKKDLSRLGTFLIMALWGLLIAMVVAYFFGDPNSLLINIAGVVIFAGLTVYDAQNIRLLMLNEETVNEGNMKLALLGALSLYLDFINLFIRLLSLFGKRK